MMNTQSSAKEIFDEGVYLVTKGEYDISISNFSKAIQLDPQFELAYMSRGVAYGKVGKVDEALVDFDKAVKLNPKNPRTYHFRGLAYMKRKDYEKAIHDFDRAIELNPRYGVAYCSRGTAKSELGDLDQAGKDMVMAARLGEANLQAFADDHNIWRTKYDKLEAEILGERERDWAATPDLKSWLETESQ
jgi:tetratricopeptide (TPR) repeat protein